MENKVSERYLTLRERVLRYQYLIQLMFMHFSTCYEVTV